jgi:Nucleotide modification associated domain 3
VASIYLINVGANCSSKARSPVFADGTFVFVPFDVSDDVTEARAYPEHCREFVNPAFLGQQIAHDDPDWTNKTYGDTLIQSRSSNLREADRGDILLFWGRLWPHAGKHGWAGFRQGNIREAGNSRRKGAYLLGALRVQRKIRSTTDNLNEDESRRVKAAMHYPPCCHDVIFLGENNAAHSGLFPRAVSLEEDRYPDGLLYRCFGMTNGSGIQNRHWMGALRSCRKVLSADMSERTLNLARAIYVSTHGQFDILSGIVDWPKPDEIHQVVPVEERQTREATAEHS